MAALDRRSGELLGALLRAMGVSAVAVGPMVACGGTVSGVDGSTADGGAGGGGAGGAGAASASGGKASGGTAAGPGGATSPPPGGAPASGGTTGAGGLVVGGTTGIGGFIIGGPTDMDAGLVVFDPNDLGGAQRMHAPVLQGDVPPDGVTCSARGCEDCFIAYRCVDADPAAECPADSVEALRLVTCGLATEGRAVVCDPVSTNARCCYFVLSRASGCPVGRPFTVHGIARVAELLPGGDWSEASGPDLSGVDAMTRAALGDYWAKEAQFEHASVASFARFLLQLLAVAAPAELVDGAQHAIHDEYEHARTCFGLAAAYGGVALRPAALPVHGALDGVADPVAIAVGTAAEGCIAETVAAMQTAMAAECATEPFVKETLERIARQEMAHAELAWTFLRWAVVAFGTDVRAAVEDVFSQAARHVSLGALTDLPGDPASMLAHGYLPPEERRNVASSVLANVVAPAARALLSPRPPTATRSGPAGSGGALPPGKILS